MRRSILISVLVGAFAGLAVAAGISLAGNGGGSSSSSGQASSAQGSFASSYAAKRGNQRGSRGGRRGGRHGHGHGHGMFFGPMALAFNGLAERLGVERSQLRDAVKGVKKRALDRAVSDGTITQAERDALEACMKSRRGSGCNKSQARAAHRKLHRAYKQRFKNDAAALKTQLLDDLAAELPGGKTGAQIGDAIRAELVELLDKGVTLGFVTEKGRELALACWDSPNQCDRKALRAEIRKRFGGHRHGGRRGGPHHP
jgi:hypothetical protein